MKSLGERFYQRIRAALAGDFGERTDERMVRWMAGWDELTVAWFVSVVERVRSAAVNAALPRCGAAFHAIVNDNLLPARCSLERGHDGVHHADYQAIGEAVRELPARGSETCGVSFAVYEDAHAHRYACDQAPGHDGVCASDRDGRRADDEPRGSRFDESPTYLCRLDVGHDGPCAPLAAAELVARSFAVGFAAAQSVPAEPQDPRTCTYGLPPGRPCAACRRRLEAGAPPDGHVLPPATTPAEKEAELIYVTQAIGGIAEMAAWATRELALQIERPHPGKRLLDLTVGELVAELGEQRVADAAADEPRALPSRRWVVTFEWLGGGRTAIRRAVEAPTAKLANAVAAATALATGWRVTAVDPAYDDDADVQSLGGAR